MHVLKKMKDCIKNSMNNNIRTGLVIMASGLGVRYGKNKLMEELLDKPLINWTVNATDNLFDKRVVVTRNTQVKAFCQGVKVDCIFHELPNRNDTVRLGLSAIMNDVDYCFFIPADQPLIKRESIAKLLEATSTGNKIIRACYKDVEGAPVGFSRLFFDDLLNLPEKKGGNWLVKNNPEHVYTVEVSEEYELWDIDTPSDLEKIKNVLKTK